MVLEYIYTDKINDLNRDNVIDLIQAAEIYSLER